MIYLTKNKIKELKTYPKSNKGIQILTAIRWQKEIDQEFAEFLVNESKKDKDIKERSERSLRRARTNIQDILNANLDDKSYFITLTFKENMQDYKKANARFNYFIRQKNKNIKYLVVKEHQKRGAIHFHLIVFDIEPDDLENLLISWSYGFKHSKKITNRYSYSIANYLTNYMTKEKNQLVDAKKKVFSKSGNLKKPLIISTEVVDEILKQHNYDVDLKAYDWTQHNYITIDKGNKVIATKIKR